MNDGSDSDSTGDSAWRWLFGRWTISALCVVLLIVALYAEEDWRGLAIWNNAQAEIAAAGESLDPKRFIPPPVPDEQNFGALPIFEVDIDPRWGADPVGMERAFAKLNAENIPTYPERDHDSGTLPYIGDWHSGVAPNLPLIRKQMAELAHYRAVLAPPSATSLDMFDLLCPALPELRAADKTHPLCRFKIDFGFQPTEAVGWSAVTSPLRLARVLGYEEHLALVDHRPDVTFADLKVGWKVDSGLRQEPYFYSGLVSVAVQAIQMGVISEGLAQPTWNQQQLAEMDRDLGAIDDLAEARFCVRGDTAVAVIPSAEYFNKHRSRVPDLVFGYPSSAMPRPAVAGFIVYTLSMLLPDGWFDEFKADTARLNLLGAVKVIDPGTRRVFPEEEEKARHLVEDRKTSEMWQSLVLRGANDGMEEMERFAYAQVQVDEARIACRLERYRLDHGQYPPSLAELSPAYGEALPHDVMNGEPYHYRLLKDGTYLLYSVGWDQMDDGGKEGPGQYHYYMNDPDWVWGNHPELKKSK